MGVGAYARGAVGGEGPAPGSTGDPRLHLCSTTGCHPQPRRRHYLFSAALRQGFWVVSHFG